MTRKILYSLFFAVVVSASCIQSVNAQSPEPQSAADRVDAVADSLLDYIRDHYAIIRLMSGLPVTEFSDLTHENAQNVAKFARKLIARLDAIPSDELSHKKWLFLQLLRHDLSRFTHNDRDYWLEFVITPYAGGFSIRTKHRVFATRKLKTQADLKNYLHLLDEYAAMLDQIKKKQ